jgi:putative ABC transport system substrate-binding protein
LRADRIALAAKHKLPAVYWDRIPVIGGGLISYGADIIDQYRSAATYVDRILRGQKPADLPVQAPTRYELVIKDGEGPRPRCASHAARAGG